MVLTDAEKRTAVLDLVYKERRRRGILSGDLRFKRVQELSCELVGEAFNLVERQLLYTADGYGAWKELKDPEILDLAYQYILKRFK